MTDPGAGGRPHRVPLGIGGGAMELGRALAACGAGQGGVLGDGGVEAHGWKAVASCRESCRDAELRADWLCRSRHHDGILVAIMA